MDKTRPFGSTSGPFMAPVTGDVPAAFCCILILTDPQLNSTLRPTCLPAGSPAKQEAVDFFNTVVALFKTLPTFTFLSNQGINPSTTQTFTLTQLTNALKAETVRLHAVLPLECFH